MLTMSDLYVNTPGLTAVEGALGRVEDELRACSATLLAATSTGLGAPGLDAACAEFVGSWSYGTEQLGQAAATVREVLAQALRVYTQIDTELASLASP